MSTATTADAALLFNWEGPRRRRVAIAIFIGVSLFLHALCFYVFQIVYPSTIVALPPPARVGLITNSSEEGRALLRWIDAEDPALISTTQRFAEGKSRALPKLQHIPSYLTEHTALKEPPPLVADLRPPGAQPPGPVPAAGRQIASNTIIVPTRVTFSEEIAGLGPAKFTTTKFAASSGEQPDNVRFRVAINAHGEVLFCFPLNSSGDAALNEQARQHMALTRFPVRSTSNDDSLVWGVATMEWGNDVTRPPARPGDSVESPARSTSPPAP